VGLFLVNRESRSRRKLKMIATENIPWCALLDRAINESLRKERRPVCAVEHGCWYCDQKYQKYFVLLDPPDTTGEDVEGMTYDRI